jgi:hypothetical protein
VLAKDTIKEAQFDTLGTRDRDWSRSSAMQASSSYCASPSGRLAASAVIVLEGNFRGEHFPRVMRLAATRGAKVLEVVLAASGDVLERRLRERAGGGKPPSPGTATLSWSMSCGRPARLRPQRRHAARRTLSLLRPAARVRHPAAR